MHNRTRSSQEISVRKRTPSSRRLSTVFLRTAAEEDLHLNMDNFTFNLPKLLKETLLADQISSKSIEKGGKRPGSRPRSSSPRNTPKGKQEISRPKSSQPKFVPSVQPFQTFKDYIDKDPGGPLGKGSTYSLSDLVAKFRKNNEKSASSNTLSFGFKGSNSTLAMREDRRDNKSNELLTKKNPLLGSDRTINMQDGRFDESIGINQLKNSIDGISLAKSLDRVSLTQSLDSVTEQEEPSQEKSSENHFIDPARSQKEPPKSVCHSPKSIFEPELSVINEVSFNLPSTVITFNQHANYKIVNQDYEPRPFMGLINVQSSSDLKNGGSKSQDSETNPKHIHTRPKVRSNHMDLLSNLSVFELSSSSEMSRNLFSLVESKIQINHYQKGQEIQKQGDQVEILNILIQGECFVSRQIPLVSVAGFPKFGLSPFTENGTIAEGCEVRNYNLALTDIYPGASFPTIDTLSEVAKYQGAAALNKNDYIEKYSDLNNLPRCRFSVKAKSESVVVGQVAITDLLKAATHQELFYLLTKPSARLDSMIEIQEAYIKALQN